MFRSILRVKAASISGAVLLGFVWTATTGAQEPQKAPIVLEEVVVTGKPVTADDQKDPYGNPVAVVTERQIKDLNAQDLPSALRRVPGVIISRQNPVGAFGGAEGGAVYIRGMGSSRPGGEIQTAVDGIPRFVGVWAHPLMDTLSIDPAEKIEIYKGAQPVLFGNSSFGVVNVVSKRREREGFSTRISGAGGSYGTFSDVLEHGGKVAETDYYLIQSFRRSAGHRDFSAGEVQEYFGRIGHQINDPLYVSLIVNRTDSFAEDPGPLGRPNERQGIYRVTDDTAVISLEHRYELGSGSLKLYTDNGKASWQDQYDLTNAFYYDTITDWNNYGIRARETLLPWSGGEAIAGADLDFVSGKVRIDRDAPRAGSTFPWETFRILSPYGSLSHRFENEEKWHLTPSAGIRLFSHDEFGNSWAPQAGLVLGYGRTELHVSYARGVNYPGIYVLTQSNLFWGGNRRWQNLEPETVDHREAGISHAFGDRLRLDVTVFRDEGQNRLLLITTPAPPHYENIARFETEGVEASLTYTPVKSLSIFAGATHLAKREPENLPYAPYWSASAGVNWRFLEPFKLSLDGQYVGGQYVANNRNANYGGSSIASVDSFYLLNGKIAWEFVLKSPPLSGEIYLAGENLTNTSYAYRKDYPMPGTNGTIGASLKF
ncbi:MAG TPA: TonB-dependent receptor plug domain-containing protein [Syntrophales bacterium]|nr:TonB-dependent receptor plug domain-containing protein [Syntrophales bacterium]